MIGQYAWVLVIKFFLVTVTVSTFDNSLLHYRVIVNKMSFILLIIFSYLMIILLFYYYLVVSTGEALNFSVFFQKSNVSYRHW